jgi:Smg protein
MFEVVAYIAHRYGTLRTALLRSSALRDELADAGYAEDEVERAIAWLRRFQAPCVVDSRDPDAQGGASRVPTREEATKLTAEARGYLLRLERAGILTLGLREAVYCLALTLDCPEIDAPKVRVLVALLLGDSGPDWERLAPAILTNDLTGLHQ